MTPSQPRSIGPYQVLGVLGRGGMAAVYRAHQSSLDRVVALKVISAHLTAEPEFMERFRQEALTAAKLNHPNIVIIHDFGEHEGVPYLVMEYVPGSTLADLMDEGLPRERVADLLAQVAAGLDYAHARGVVHRDIKPQNVLVTDEGRAVLADFGLARLVESTQRITMAGGVVGTPEYMSPEQAAGRPSDHRADVYALGVLLYEMLAGVRPFAAETPLGTLLKHLQEPPPSIRTLQPDIPPAVEAVLEKALAKKPEERYQSAGELARAYREAVGASADGATAVLPTHVPLERAELGAPDAPLPVAPSVPQAEAQPVVPPPPPAERHCPECDTAIPPGVSMCPSCMYLLPFDEVANKPRRELERREFRVNLLPYHLRWDPNGLDRARALLEGAVHDLTAQGWDLVSNFDDTGVFIQGRGVAGPIVQGAVLVAQRPVGETPSQASSSAA